MSMVPIMMMKTTATTTTTNRQSIAVLRARGPMLSNAARRALCSDVCEAMCSLFESERDASLFKKTKQKMLVNKRAEQVAPPPRPRVFVFTLRVLLAYLSCCLSSGMIAAYFCFCFSTNRIESFVSRSVHAADCLCTGVLSSYPTLADVFVTFNVFGKGCESSPVGKVCFRD